MFFSLRETFISPTEVIISKAHGGDLLRRVAFSLLGLFGVGGLIRGGLNRLTINGGLGWLILFYFGWASLSFTWADDVAFTLRRLIVFWMLCLGALAMSKHFSLRDIILWVFFATGVFLLIGVASAIVLGTFRPFAPGYRFSGTLQPNPEGINCAMFLLASAVMSSASKRGRWFFIVCACVGLVLLVLTGSRTAFAGSIAALLVYWALVSSPSRNMAWFLGFSIVAGVCLLFLLVENELGTSLRHGILLGRPATDASTFTGRIPLWKECLDYAAKRPLQGYGYEGFFTPSRIAEIAATQGWGFFNAHSAYLQLLLGTGMIGLTSFALILILSIKESVARFRVSLSPGHAYIAAAFVFSMLHGVLEAGSLMGGMFSFTLLLVATHLGFAVPKNYTSRISRGGDKACNS